MLSLRRRAKAGPLDRLLDPEDEFWQRYREAIFPVVLQLAIPIVLAGAKAGRRVQMAQKASPALRIVPPQSPHLSDAALRRIMRDTIRGFSSDLTNTLFGTTYDAVKEAVAKAAAEGKPVSAVIRDLKPLFGPDRARTIAVTETTRLMGAGSQAIYRAADISSWQWLTVRDDLVCPVCEDLDETVFSQAEDFEPAHPRCRCFPAPVEDEEPLDLRAAQWTVALRFDPEQPRDEFGRWTDAGGAVGAGWERADRQLDWKEDLSESMISKIEALPEAEREEFIDALGGGKQVVQFDRGRVSVQFPTGTDESRMQAAMSTLTRNIDANPPPAKVSVSFNRLSSETAEGLTLPINGEFKVSIRDAYVNGEQALSTSFLKDQVPASVLASGASARDYVITHEYGHTLDPNTSESYGYGHTAMGVSRYASSDPREAFAESYAAFMLGGEKTEPAAMNVAQLMGWKR